MLFVLKYNQIQINSKFANFMVFFFNFLVFTIRKVGHIEQAVVCVTQMFPFLMSPKKQN